MQRSFFNLTVMALVTVLGMGSAVAAEPAPVMLNPHIVLTKDMLTVGDLFEPAGPNADHVLAAAPKAGTELTLTRDELQRVADSFHIDWHSDDANLTAVIERDALIVTPAMLSEALAKSDLSSKIDKEADIAVQSPVDGIVLNGQALPDIRFEAVSYDALSQSFTAIAVLSRDGKTVLRTIVAGLATKMIDVPVLTTAMERGVRIGSADVTTIRLPAKDMKPSQLTRLDDIVGMVTKKTIHAEQPLAKTDLAEPVLVRRNEIVTVVYQNGAIALSTKARSLVNGVRGETVQLENPSSKKIIEATVTGPQQVTISMDGMASING